ncbi:unnamed protein product [Linum trigynum]|uniref:RNase H type-1 domain-containing protein n=1 Tax=Linum trigynum TaxID=586398 RepID=A0AAV2GUQ2_9ROSI
MTNEGFTGSAAMQVDQTPAEEQRSPPQTLHGSSPSVETVMESVEPAKAEPTRSYKDLVTGEQVREEIEDDLEDEMESDGEGEPDCPNKLSQKILAWEVVAQQSKQAEQTLSLGRSGSRRDVAVGWRPAPTGWITVNSNGLLLRPSGSTAAGGALRDWQGRLLGAYTMNLGKCTITRAEIWGALKGLELAWEAGHRQVELQLDSRTAMSLLQVPGQHNHQHADLTLSFQALLRRDWDVRIIHIYREANFLADCLAHKGHSLTPGFHSVHVSDPDVCHWTMFDSVGGFTVRSIYE